MFKIFSIIFLILACSVFGEFTQPFQINSDRQLSLDGRKGVFVADNVIYTAFIEKISNVDYRLQFAEYDLDWQLLNETTLHTSTGLIYTHPVIIVNNSYIYISFSDIANGRLKCAVSEDNGESFVIHDIDGYVLQTPEVHFNNGIPEFVYTREEEYPYNKYTFFVHRNTGIVSDPLTFSTLDNNFFGRVHSNTAIDYIFIHGEPGNSYPPYGINVLFEDLLTTHELYSYPGNEDVNKEGYLDFTDSIIVSDMNTLEEITVSPFGPYSENHDIIYCKIDGNMVNSWIGDVIDLGPDTIAVYGENYPYEQSEIIGYNVITRKDTLWTQGPVFDATEAPIKVNNVLWIEGTVAGNQIWFADKEVYLTDDILYNSTIPMEQPTDNLTDFFTLISQEQIFFKYGHYDPSDSLQKKPNCDGVIFYGSFIAMKNSQDPSEDGLFTFEYQHPHPSTEPITVNDTLYTEIDLHRYLLSDWPGDIDYPWYNPIYPEEDPTFLREELNLFGSMLTYCRGYLTLSGDYYIFHVNTDIWDFDSHKFGGSHNRTGYSRNHYIDHRVNKKLYELLFNQNPQKFTVKNFVINNGAPVVVEIEALNHPLFDKAYPAEIFFSGAHSLARNTDNGYESLVFFDISADTYEPVLTFPADEDREVKQFVYGNQKAILTEPRNQIGPDILTVLNDNNIFMHFMTCNSEMMVCNEQGIILLAEMNDSATQFKEIGDQLLTEVAEINHDYIISDYSVAVHTTGHDSLLVIYSKNANQTDWGSFYFSKGSIDGFTPADNHVVPSESDFRIYPLPFTIGESERTALTIKYSLPESTHLEISVFNLKGQKVTTLINDFTERGENYLSWNCLNNQGKKVASGVYLFKMKSGQKSIIKKALLLK